MKNIIITILFLMSVNLSAQGIFDKLEDLDDVSSVVVNKDMFELLKKFPDTKSENMELFNTIKGLNELKVFSTTKQNVAVQMENMVKTSAKNNKLTQLMRVKDSNSRVKIYVKSTNKKDIVSEVLMFVNSTENTDKTATIISLTGQIDVNKLAGIAKKMK